MNLINRNNNVFPAILSELLENDVFNSSHKHRNIPAVNLKESNKSYIIDLAAAGLDKEDFKINLEDNILKISSEKSTTNTNDSESYTRKEFNYNAFSRSFILPDSANQENITAHYKNGILNIIIPKKEENKPSSKSIIIE